MMESVRRKCFFIVILSCIVWLRASCSILQIAAKDIYKNKYYVAMNNTSQVVVSHAEQNGQLLPSDQIILVDGKMMFPGSIQAFLESENQESVVPIVDNSDESRGGQRLLGFVILRQFVPKAITVNRGPLEVKKCSTNADCGQTGALCTDGVCICRNLYPWPHCEVIIDIITRLPFKCLSFVVSP